MNLNQLHYVLAVYEEKSFSKASDRCNVTQPTLSNGIAALEEEFGGKLFNRNTRKCEISSFGRQLLPLIEGVLHAQRELRAGVHSYHQPERKMIRIGLSPLVDARLIKNCVESFFTQEYNVDIFYKECFLDDLNERLQDQTIDMMVRPLTTNSIISEDKVASRLHSEDIYFLPRISGPSSVFDNAPVTVEDIRDEIFIVTNGGCGLSDFITNLFFESGLELNVYPGEAVSYQVLSDWSELGIGAALLPASRVSIEAGLRAKPLLDKSGEPIRVDYFAYWLKSGTYPDYMNALHNYFREIVPKYIEGLCSP